LQLVPYLKTIYRCGIFELQIARFLIFEIEKIFAESNPADISGEDSSPGPLFIEQPSYDDEDYDSSYELENMEEEEGNATPWAVVDSPKNGCHYLFEHDYCNNQQASKIRIFLKFKILLISITN
jgi:hypothetical protein